jgi:hypothetical protein
MSAALLILKQYWRQIAGAAVLIAAVIYLGGIHARIKMQAGTIAKLEAELSAERTNRQIDRRACAEIAQQLTDQQAAVQLLTDSMQAAQERHARAMADAVRQSEITRRAAEIRAQEAAEAVAAAETCEERERAFLAGLTLPGGPQ